MTEELFCWVISLSIYNRAKKTKNIDFVEEKQKLQSKAGYLAEAYNWPNKRALPSIYKKTNTKVNPNLLNLIEPNLTKVNTIYPKRSKVTKMN